jgi:hypothetical protein
MANRSSIVLSLCFFFGSAACGQSSPQQQQQQQQAPLDPAALDKVLAPIALYPDALVAQILMCSTNVTKVRDLQAFIQKNKNLKGTALQEAAGKQGFDPSYVALTLFPQVVKTMNDSIGWTRQMGQAFTADKKAVFESLQRLRTLALDVGNLKTTPQQEVQKVDQNGQQVIVIQPANPQVVYVPQYNSETVYTTPAPPVTQTIVVHEDDDSDELAAGMIGFGVGVAMGAAMNSNYYYGPYGWGGYGMAYGGFYGSGYDDVLDHREDMMDDYYDHREDMQENRKDMAEDREGKTRSDQQSTRQQSAADRQASRESGTTTSASDRQASRQAGTTPSTSDRQTSRQAGGASASTQDLGSRSSSRSAGGAGVSSLPSGYESRGYGQSASQTSRSRSSSGAGGMSGYERGSSTRSTSSRGRSSMGGGGGRSRGGGGRRR